MWLYPPNRSIIIDRSLCGYIHQTDWSIIIDRSICGYIHQTEVYLLNEDEVWGRYISVGLYNHILTEYKNYNCYIINHHQQINN